MSDLLCVVVECGGGVWWWSVVVECGGGVWWWSVVVECGGGVWGWSVVVECGGVTTSLRVSVITPSCRSGLF